MACKFCRIFLHSHGSLYAKLTAGQSHGTPFCSCKMPGLFLLQDLALAFSLAWKASLCPTLTGQIILIFQDAVLGYIIDIDIDTYAYVYMYIYIYIYSPTLQKKKNQSYSLSESSFIRSLEVSASISLVRSSCLWNWWWFVSLGIGGWHPPRPLPERWVQHQALSESLLPCGSPLHGTREREARRAGTLWWCLLLGSHGLDFLPINPQINKQLRLFASISGYWMTLSRKLV